MFFPQVTARIQRLFQVSSNHNLYIEEYGNPHGIPVIVIHGGPGSSSNSDLARYFDPTKYRTILYDQRGCGKSTPRNCIIDNTTEDLIEDLEKIRIAFNLEKPVLFGGSWGSTLALLYAERYPQNVRALILRGIYLGGDSAYMQENSIAAQTRREGWSEFKKAIFPLNSEQPREYTELLQELYKYATNDDPNIWQPIAMALTRWETINSCAESEVLKRKLEQLETSQASKENAWTMGRIEILYKANRFWLTENQILNNAFKLKDIPVYIVHGNNDTVCHRSFPEMLINRLNAANIKFLSVTWTEAGHAGTEPANISALVAATCHFAEQELEKSRNSCVTPALTSTVGMFSNPQLTLGLVTVAAQAEEDRQRGTSLNTATVSVGHTSG